LTKCIKSLLQGINFMLSPNRTKCDFEATPPCSFIISPQLVQRFNQLISYLAAGDTIAGGRPMESVCQLSASDWHSGFQDLG
jgi:hypothetical protein